MLLSLAYAVLIGSRVWWAYVAVAARRWWGIAVTSALVDMVVGWDSCNEGNLFALEFVGV